MYKDSCGPASLDVVPSNEFHSRMARRAKVGPCERDAEAYHRHRWLRRDLRASQWRSRNRQARSRQNSFVSKLGDLQKDEWPLVPL